MSKEREIKVFANITLWIILIGAVVIISGFGISLHIAQKEVMTDVDGKVQRDIDYLNAFIDGNLQRIEDAGYSFCSLVFGDVVRENGDDGYIELSESYIRKKPSPEVIYDEMEKFMRATPIVCGIAIEFEPYVYPEVKSQYGFTPYVTNVSGEYERLDLGEKQFRMGVVYRDVRCRERILEQSVPGFQHRPRHSLLLDSCTSRRKDICNNCCRYRYRGIQ